MSDEYKDRSPVDDKRRVHTFTNMDTARLFHLLSALLPFPQHVDISSDEGGEEIYALEKLLLFRMGQLSLGSGTIKMKMERYITIGDDERILTLVELAAVAPIEAAKGRRLPPSYSPQAHAARVMTVLNQWLESTAHEARFVNGKFEREGFADTAPKAVTDLPKREELAGAINRILSERGLVSVAFIDIDHFKRVNDTLGHAAGDACLESVVTTICRVIAGKGKLYRYGGDEFCAALKNFSLEEAVVTCERIRTEIEAANSGGEVKVTASIGVASSTQLESGTAEQLLDIADRAAYQSKDAGRNRVSVWKVPLSIGP